MRTLKSRHRTVFRQPIIRGDQRDELVSPAVDSATMPDNATVLRAFYKEVSKERATYAFKRR